MKLQNVGDILRITAIKELSAANANAFRDEARRAFGNGQTNIEIDLSQTTAVDSCGLGALVALHKTAATRGGALRLSLRRIADNAGMLDQVAPPGKRAPPMAAVARGASSRSGP